jgi:hypothetical protein
MKRIGQLLVCNRNSIATLDVTSPAKYGGLGKVKINFVLPYFLAGF